MMYAIPSLSGLPPYCSMQLLPVSSGSTSLPGWTEASEWTIVWLCGSLSKRIDESRTLSTNVILFPISSVYLLEPPRLLPAGATVAPRDSRPLRENRISTAPTVAEPSVDRRDSVLAHEQGDAVVHRRHPRGDGYAERDGRAVYLGLFGSKRLAANSGLRFEESKAGSGGGELPMRCPSQPQSRDTPTDNGDLSWPCRHRGFLGHPLAVEVIQSVEKTFGRWIDRGVVE